MNWLFKWIDKRIKEAKHKDRVKGLTDAVVEMPSRPHPDLDDSKQIGFQVFDADNGFILTMNGRDKAGNYKQTIRICNNGSELFDSIKALLVTKGLGL